MSSSLQSQPLGPSSPLANERRIGRGRRAVLLVAVLVLIPKLLLAWRTGGTGDIGTWETFAAGVKEKGPVGVYSIDFWRTSNRLYNHPPLAGWLLELMNGLSPHGLQLRFSLRAIASIADVGSALLTFEILRRRSPLPHAIAAGMLVGASPVLVLISGYHGNTDPLFVALVLLGAFLLVDKQMALMGGAALALALSIKIVPVVVLPTLAVYVVRYQRDLLRRTSLGFAVVFIVLWAAPLLTEWHAIVHHVIGYSGIASRQWGFVALAKRFHTVGLVNFLNGPGKDLCILLACAVPAAIVWRRPDYAVQGVCLALVMFLTLSPAFGVQYLAWALAAACILNLRMAALYSAVAALFLFLVYDHWNRGLPWTGISGGERLTAVEVNFGLAAWFVLVVLVVNQLHSLLRSSRLVHAQPT